MDHIILSYYLPSLKVSIKDILFIVFAGLYLALLASQRLYPFIDLPNHLAEAVVYKNQDVFEGFYRVSERDSTNGFYYHFCSMFSNIETGNKVYYSMYMMLFLMIGYLIIRKWRGNTWFALLLFPLLLNYNVTYGFVGFTLGIPFVLVIYCLLGNKDMMSRVGVAVLLMVLFYIHILCLLFALFLVVACIFFENPRWNIFLRKIWIVIPATGMIVYWYLSVRAFETGESTLTFLTHYYAEEFLLTYYKRAKIFAFDNLNLFSGTQGLMCGLFFTLVAFLPVLIWGYDHLSLSSVKAFFNQHRSIASLIFVSVICCFFLPDQLPGQPVLYQRFSVFLTFSFVLMGSVLFRDRENKRLTIVFTCIAAIHLLLWFDYFRDFNRINEPFTKEIFTEIPSKEPMGGLITDCDFRGRPVYIHFPSYRIVWNNGIATTSLIDYRFGSVRRDVPFSILPQYQEWAGITYRFIPPEYKDLKYILVKGELEVFPQNAVSVAYSRDWKIIRKEGL